MDINTILEQGEKEFEEKFKIMSIGYHKCEGWNDIDELEIDTGYVDNIKEVFDWHKAQQHKLLQSIVEMIEGMKDYDIEDTDFDEGSPSYNETHNRGYHKALTDLKAKLTTNIKE